MESDLPTAEEDLVCTEFATDKEAQIYYFQLRGGSANDRWQARCADALKVLLLSKRGDNWSHFDLSLDRDFSNGEGRLVVRGKCKDRSPSHKDAYASYESALKSGVSNWSSGVKACGVEAANNVNVEGGDRGVSRMNRPTGFVTQLLNSQPFLTAQALLLHIAGSSEPFTRIDPKSAPYLADAFLQANAKAKLQSDSTMRRHLILLHAALSEQFGEFLVKRNRGVHLVIDGWTAPNTLSIISVVAVYEEGGVVHRHILSFIESKGRHGGRELAESLHKTIDEEFKISYLVRTLVMDNASNCDKMAEYQMLNPNWYGPKMRVRCFAYILQLVMGALYAAFCMPPARKPSTKTSQARPKAGISSQAQPSPSETEVVLDAEDQQIDDGIAQAQVAVCVDRQTDVTALQMATSSSKECLRLAFEWAQEERINVSTADRKKFMHIIPTIAEFAQHISGSRAKAADKRRWLLSVENTAHTRPGSEAVELDRKNETRWNSTQRCLESHLLFAPAVQDYLDQEDTSDPISDRFTLPEDALPIVKKLVKIGESLKKLTVQFQEGEPRPWRVIAQFEILEKLLDKTTRTIGEKAILRIAAKSALQVLGEYYAKVGDDGLALFGSMFFQPRHHFRYFRLEKGAWDDDSIEEKKKDLHKMFLQIYVPAYGDQGQSTASSSLSTDPEAEFYEDDDELYGSQGVRVTMESDAFLEYFSSSPPFLQPSDAYGGCHIKYWTAQRKIPGQKPLAEMTIDFLIIPPTACDAERAFSAGQRTISYTQHRTSAELLNAKMCLGSWANPNDPLFGPEPQDMITLQNW